MCVRMYVCTHVHGSVGSVLLPMALFGAAALWTRLPSHMGGRCGTWMVMAKPTLLITTHEKQLLKTQESKGKPNRWIHTFSLLIMTDSLTTLLARMFLGMF